MATFPAGAFSWTTLTDNTDSVLAAHPNSIAAEVVALQTKVGVDNSVVSDSHDYKLRHLPLQEQNLDIGSYELRAQTLQSDISTGTAPLIVASTTLVSNLNADKLDGQEGSYYLNCGNFNAGTLSVSRGGTGSASTTFCNLTTNVTGILPIANGGLGSSFASTAQGNILYFSAAGTISALSPGTSGYYLKTQGAAANPVWAENANDFQLISATSINSSNSGDISISPDKIYKIVMSLVMTESNSRPRIRFNSDSGNYYDWAFSGRALSDTATAVEGENGSNDDIEFTYSVLDSGVAVSANFMLDTTKKNSHSAFLSFESLYYYNSKYWHVTGGAVYKHDVTLSSFELYDGDAKTLTGTIYLYELAMS